MSCQSNYSICPLSTASSFPDICLLYWGLVSDFFRLFTLHMVRPEELKSIVFHSAVFTVHEDIITDVYLPEL